VIRKFVKQKPDCITNKK